MESMNQSAGGAKDSMHRSTSQLVMDYAAHTGDSSFSWIKLVYRARHIPGLHYMAWFRLCNASKHLKLLNRFCERRLYKTGIKYGFDVPSDTKIGGGFCIKHHGLLIINHQCAIGENCTVVCGTVIGKSKGKIPVLGNGVEIGANVSIIGGVTVGDGAKIGAGSVVTRDVAPNTVVAGNPARLLAGR